MLFWPTIYSWELLGYFVHCVQCVSFCLLRKYSCKTPLKRVKDPTLLFMPCVLYSMRVQLLEFTFAAMQMFPYYLNVMFQPEVLVLFLVFGVFCILYIDAIFCSPCLLSPLFLLFLLFYSISLVCGIIEHDTPCEFIMIVSPLHVQWVLTDSVMSSLCMRRLIKTCCTLLHSLLYDFHACQFHGCHGNTS